MINPRRLVNKITPETVREVGLIYQELKRRLPRQLRKFSPKKFTVSQIATLVVLKKLASKLGPCYPKTRMTFSGVSYREIVRIFRESEELRAALELKRAPHHTTLAHSKVSAMIRAGLKEDWQEGGPLS